MPKPKTKRKARKPAGKPINTSAHTIIKSSYSFLRLNAKFMGRIVLVALLVNLVLGFVFEEPIRQVYQSLWFVFVSCALIWGIRHSQGSKSKKQATLSEAFWDGTAPVLKMLVVLSLLIIATTPFSLGAFIFGTINYLSLDSVLADVIAVASWLLLAIISLLFISRLLIAPVIVSLPGVGPWQAIVNSWALSRYRTFAIAKRLGMLFAYTVILLGVLVVGLSTLGASAGLIQIALEILGYGLIMPFIYVYVFMTYKQLS